MARAISVAFIGAVIGLVAGYFIFGEIAGVRVSLQALLNFGDSSTVGGALRQAGSQLVGIDVIRRNILLTGAGGAILALFLAVAAGGRRRRR